MKKLIVLAGVLSTAFCSCTKNKPESDMVSQRFIHKYGYAVTQEEWESHNYPGQVVSHLRNGVTVTKTFESGIEHGPCTYTYPDSEVVEKFQLFDKGNVVKEVHYDPSGMPVEQKVILSPTRYQLTHWYKNGSPRSIEEYAQDELLEAQYFSSNNDLEAKVEKGNGLRVIRNDEGQLVSKEVINAGYKAEKETFYNNGTLESVEHFKLGKLHGEKKVFAASGEPVAVEEYIDGKLHGKAVYFRNGNKFRDISFINGEKNGLETHYVDGEQVSYQVLWENDKKHGPEKYFTQDTVTVQYFYNGEPISRSRYEELQQLDDMIAQISPDVQRTAE